MQFKEFPHVFLALHVKVPPDEHGPDDVAQVAVDVGHAELLPGGRLLAAVEHPVEGVLGGLEATVQVVDAVADEAPQDVVGDGPGILGEVA